MMASSRRHPGFKGRATRGKTIMEPTAGKLFGLIGDAVRLATGMAAQQPLAAPMPYRPQAVAALYRMRECAAR
jgi:hypothetical protein